MPELPDPTLTYTDPPRPEAADPEPIYNPPLLPLLLDPLLNTNSPLVPDPPAFDVLIEIVPLDV